MDPTQELNDFLKSHPVEKKSEVPQEIRDKITQRVILACEYMVAHVGRNGLSRFGAKVQLNAIAEFGYRLAQEQLATKDKEIERLKKDLESLENFIQIGKSH